MENQLEILKAHLPFGYEKKIAAKVGCSVGTVNNILNTRKCAVRSAYKNKVIKVAQQMAEENLKVMEEVATTTAVCLQTKVHH